LCEVEGVVVAPPLGPQPMFLLIDYDFWPKDLSDN